MSLARFTPLNLPRHRRPPEWGGTGKDPVWTTLSTIFAGPLTYNPDSLTHANAAAAFDMPVAAMQAALAGTRLAWAKISPPTTTPPAPAGRPPEKAPR
jgi:hypothetical protein